VATMVPRTQAILRARRRRCLRGSRAAIIYAAASRLDLFAAAQRRRAGEFAALRRLREQRCLSRSMRCGDGVVMTYLDQCGCGDA
jgi:hypothetical protein